MSDNSDAQATLHAQLTEQLVGVFDGAAETQRAYYDENPDKRPTRGDVDSIISKYSYMNAAIAGGLSLVPGPWGLLAVVPEIVVVIRNQVKMVYDIGVAYGKDDVMTRELLLGITLSASGAGTIGLLTMHGGKVLVKRKALRVFQKLVAVFAGKVTQRLIKSTIAKWLPVVGAFAMAAWTKSSTTTIGRKAKEVLAMDIDLAQEDESRLLVDRGEVVTEEAPVAAENDALVQKLHALANLMKADGRIADEEIEFLETILANSDLDMQQVESLRASFVQPQHHAVDFGPFQQDEDEALALMMDLVALANHDGEFHPAEKMYVKRVAKKIGFPDDEVAVLIS